jgi:tRNA(Phe) wybutosine-synthesizing methylase Tyw3
MTRASKTWVASSSVMVARTSGFRASSVACSSVMSGGKVEVLTGRVDVDVDSGMDGSVVVGTDVLDIVVVVEGTAVDVVV